MSPIKEDLLVLAGRHFPKCACYFLRLGLKLDVASTELPKGACHTIAKDYIKPPKQ